MTDEEKITIDQYGRRSWNVDVYTEEAKKKSKKSKKSQSVTSTLEKSSYISGNQSSSYITHRTNLLQESLAAVKTHNLINPLNSISSYGKNKRFGFFCPLCDLSFRDNLALIDHINSPQHVAKAKVLSKATTTEGEEGLEELDGGIRRATVEEVISTIESLVAKSVREKSESKEGTDSISLKERIEKRKEFERKKHAKRKEKWLKQKSKLNIASLTGDQQGEDNDIAAMMGFGGFGSTKK